MAALLIMSLLRIIFTLSLVLEQFQTDFLIGLQENTHPCRTMGNAVPDCGCCGLELGTEMGGAGDMVKLSCIT